MTVPDIKACVNLQGNGTNQGYSFHFQINDITDVKINAIDSSGNVTSLQNGTDYTVTTTQGVSGGDVTFTGWTNLGNDITFEIYRSEPIEQQYIFEEDERISPTTLESALDYRCRIEQELACEIDGINNVLAGVASIPDASNATDGQILEANNNQWVITDQRVPDPSTIAQGYVLGVDNNKIVGLPNVAVGRELPSGGTTGQILEKKSATDYDVQWGTPPDNLPDTSGHDNDHLIVDPTTHKPKWATERLPVAQTSNNGNFLGVDASGNYVLKDISSSINPSEMEAAGVYDGYTVTNTASNINISQIKAQFISNGQIVKKTVSATTQPIPNVTGIRYLVLHLDGSYTFETIRPELTSEDRITIASLDIRAGVIETIQPEATDVTNVPDTLKYVLKDIIGGKVSNGILVASGANQLSIDSTTAGVLNIWRYAVNSADIDHYNFANWTFSNPLQFIFIDKDGTESSPNMLLDFSTLQYYDLTGTLNNLPQNDKTELIVYIKPSVPNTLYITYGYGVYDQSDLVLEPQSVLLEYSKYIPDVLKVFGVPFAIIVGIDNQDFNDMQNPSYIIPFSGAFSASAGGQSPTDAHKRSFDVSNGLLGTCQITANSQSATSLDLAFTGDIVIADDTKKELSFIKPLNVTVDLASRIIQHDFTYIFWDLTNNTYLLKDAYSDSPRGTELLLAVVDHTDRKAIQHVYEVYTSSDVDAHRIKDIWKSYRPQVRGCVPSFVSQQDPTDTQRTITGFQVSEGTFFNYTADPSKRYDNYLKHMPSIPFGGEFVFRSIEPKEYGDTGTDWDKGDLSTKYLYFPSKAYLIASDGTKTALPDGSTTFYPMYMNVKQELVLGVPDDSVPSDQVASKDVEGFVRKYEAKMDDTLWRDYAEFGVVSVKNDGGTIIWDVASDVKELQNKFSKSHGDSTKLPSHNFSTALVEHKNGVIQEYDPLAYTFGFYGEMEGYPNDALKELTKAYFDNPTDDDSADATAGLLGLHDLFDTMEVSGTTSPNKQNNFRVTDNYYDWNPTPQNNHSIPPIFKSIYKNTENSNRSTIDFTAKKNCKLVIKLKINIVNSTPIKLSSFTLLTVYFSYNKIVNPLFTVNDFKITGGNVGNLTWTFQSDSLQLILPSLPLISSYDILDGIEITFPEIQVVANDGFPSNTINYISFNIKYDYASRSILGDPNQYSQTNEWTLDFYDTTAPKDHIRLKYGKLAELNTGGAGITNGDIPNDIVAGDVVLILETKPKASSWQPKTYWNCFAEHTKLINSLPTIFLFDSSNNITKTAELVRVLAYNKAMYVLKAVDADDIANKDIGMRIQDTTDVSGILANMNLKLGAVMADDAF